MRVLLVFSIVAFLVLVCLANFMFGLENFEPKTEHILNTEGWRPFLKGVTQVGNATQNMDDGSIVFTMRPEFEDWNAYFNTISQDAERAGWVDVPVGDTRFSEKRYAVKSYVTKILRESANPDAPIRNSFTREYKPAYETDFRAKEVVEITLLDHMGTVLFVSYYAYD